MDEAIVLCMKARSKIGKLFVETMGLWIVFWSCVFEIELMNGRL